MSGPKESYSREVMLSNHRLVGEDHREGVNRICGALKDDDKHFRTLRDIIMDDRFLFGGRIQASAGSPKSTTMHNCFVSGTIADSFVEGDGCITDRFVEAATTLRMGGGIGYDFSTLRPSGAMIRKLDSTSSGPMAFMSMFNAMARTVSSSGHRRGAQMGVMRIDHPDIMNFIHAKQTAGALDVFNLSIGVTDEFMRCLAEGRSFNLRFNGHVYQTIDPKMLWDMVMRSTWDYAEPGVVFLDTINRENNLWYCEKIAATNPCGEQPLPPYGACLLGSLNLVRYLVPAEGGGYSIDMDQIEEDMPDIVRAMDNVNDLSHFPLEQQRVEAMNKRRMGIGVTGLANAIEACGYLYGSSEFLRLQAELMKCISEAAYMASAMLAVEKGAFPLFDKELFGRQGFISKMDEGIRETVKETGLRNSHLLSIAPTGSISFGLGDNVSSSIEPVFSYSQDRTIVEEGLTRRVDPVTDYGFRVLGVKGKRTKDVTIEEHLAVLKVSQDNVDSAVSKTINIDGSVQFEEFCGVYTRAYEQGAKGCTTFRVDGKREGVIHDTDTDNGGPTCEIMPDGSKSCE